MTIQKRTGRDPGTGAPEGNKKQIRQLCRAVCCVILAVLLIPCTVSCARQNADTGNGTTETTTAAPVTETTAEPATEASSAEPTTEPTTAAPVTETTAEPATETPSAEPTTEPVTEAPTAETTAEPTTEPTTAETTSAAPVTETEAPTSAVPAEKAEIVSFFAAAVNRVKNENAASYDKVEYQKIHDVHMTGNATTDNMIKNIISGFAKDENSAPHTAAQKGTASSGENMLGWGLADDSAVVSATLEETGGNYKITLVMADEDTPDRANPRHLEAMGSVTYREEVEDALRSVPQMNEFSDIHLIYTGYTVTAEITPDGRLISLRHHTDIEVTIGRLKVAFFTLENKSVSLENNVVFTGFAY